MAEAAIAVVGIVVIWFVAVTAHALLENRGMWQYFIYAFLGAGALYCLIRFVRWAWNTPMPFVGT
ncbi:MAG: hypothetical protein WBE37_32825 [Bryobacteraceae bacterium]